MLTSCEVAVTLRHMTDGRGRPMADGRGRPMADGRGRPSLLIHSSQREGRPLPYTVEVNSIPTMGRKDLLYLRLYNAHAHTERGSLFLFLFLFLFFFWYFSFSLFLFCFFFLLVNQLVIQLVILNVNKL